MSPPKISVRRTIAEYPPPTPQPTPCRLWQGTIAGQGYGSRRVAGVPMPVYVHRWAWAMANGPIPAGLHVMHKCDNRLCFRIDHLQLGTRLDNMSDMVNKGRQGMLGKRGTRGEASAMAKLTNGAVREIRQRYESGETVSSLARSFGVTRTTIRNAAIGRTWVDVA